MRNRIAQTPTFTEDQLYVALFRSQLERATRGQSLEQKMILINITFAQNISHAIHRKMCTETLEEMTTIYFQEMVRCK